MTTLASSPSFDPAGTMPQDDDDKDFAAADNNNKETNRAPTASKYGDGIRNLTTTLGEADSASATGGKPKVSTSSARAAASDSIALEAPAAARDSTSSAQSARGSSCGAIPDVVENCFNYLHNGKPQDNSAANAGGESLADKLKKNVERSKKLALAKTAAGAGEREVSDENLNIEKSETIKKREKAERGRSPPRSSLNTPGPKQRDSSAGKKPYKDFLADDDNDEEEESDDGMNLSSSLKEMMTQRHSHSSVSPGRRHDYSSVGKHNHDDQCISKDGGLSPPSELTRSKSEGRRRSKSPMRRCRSEEEVAPPPSAAMKRSISMGSNDDSEGGVGASSGRVSRSPPRQKVGRCKSSSEGRRPIPRPSRSSKEAIEAMAAAAGKASIKRTSSSGPHDKERESLSRSPSRRGLTRAQSSRVVDGQSRSPGPRQRHSEGLSLSASQLMADEPELRRSYSGGSKASDGKSSAGSRSSSRGVLARMRSSREAGRSKSPCGSEGMMASNSSLEGIDEPQFKRTQSTGSVGSRSEKESGASGRLAGRSRSPKRHGGLNVASEHRPRRRPGRRQDSDRSIESSDSSISPSRSRSRNRVMKNDSSKNDSNGDVRSATARHRRPRLTKTTSERNISPRRSQPEPLLKRAKSDQEGDNIAPDHPDDKRNDQRRRRARDHRSGLSRGTSRRNVSHAHGDEDTKGASEEIEAVPAPALNRGASTGNPTARRGPLDIGDEDHILHSMKSGGSRPKKPGMQRSLSEKELDRRSPERKTRDFGSGEIPDTHDSDKPGKRGESDRRHAGGRGGRREDGERRTPRRTVSGRARRPGDEDRARTRPPRSASHDLAKTGTEQRRRPRRRTDDDRSDGDLSPDESPTRSNSRGRRSGEERERPRGRRSPRQGEVGSRSSSPSKAHNTRTKKVGGRNQQDIARNQYANMVKHYDPDEVLARYDDEAEEEEAAQEEDLTTPEGGVHEEEETGKKNKLGFVSAFASTAAKTVKQGASLATQTASTTAKLGVKVAAKTTQTAANVATQTASTTAKVATSTAKTAVKAVSDLGKSSHHVKNIMLDEDPSRHDGHGGFKPAASISMLAGAGLGESSSAFMRSNNGFALHQDDEDTTDEDLIN